MSSKPQLLSTYVIVVVYPISWLSSLIAVRGVLEIWTLNRTDKRKIISSAKVVSTNANETKPKDMKYWVDISIWKWIYLYKIGLLERCMLISVSVKRGFSNSSGVWADKQDPLKNMV